jgi:hypothetical protein
MAARRSAAAGPAIGAPAASVATAPPASTALDAIAPLLKDQK